MGSCVEDAAVGAGPRGRCWRSRQAEPGVCPRPTIEDHQAELGHELSDCLWSIIVPSNKCGADLEAEFVKDVRMIRENVEGELAKER